MFNEFLNLKMDPFAETPDTRFFFQAEQQGDVMERLIHDLDRGLGFTLLSAEVGTGKTLLSRMLIKRVEKMASSALLLFPALEGRDLFAAIAEEFGLAVEPTDSLKTIIDRITDFLLANAKAGKRTILIIDEAQNMSLSALESIRQLSNIEQEAVKLLQIILVGQPELNEKLKSHEARQINQRIVSRLELTGLTRPETAKYIKHRIEIAGGCNFIKFEDSAANAIHQLSDGLPRLINLQCRLVIDFAVRNQLRLIENKHVVRALNEAGILVPHFSRPWRREVKLVQV